jgi:hypothetical protein
MASHTGFGSEEKTNPGKRETLKPKDTKALA